MSSSAPKETREEFVRARLSAAEASALREYADRHGLSTSAVVRHSLTASGALPPGDRAKSRKRC